MFSSDDEVSINVKSKSKSASKSSRKSAVRSIQVHVLGIITKPGSSFQSRSGGRSVASLEEVMEEVSNLSDDQLFQQLKSFNVDIGPIVESTRALYQKKLASLIQASESGAQNGQENAALYHR